LLRAAKSPSGLVIIRFVIVSEHNVVAVTSIHRVACTFQMNEDAKTFISSLQFSQKATISEFKTVLCVGLPMFVTASGGSV
jgi:hypothetical protein